jgi:protein O-GlcNAc transferase
MSTVTIQEAIEIGMQHHQAGRLAEAEAVYQEIIAQHPNHSDAFHLLGIAAHQNGNHQNAVEFIDRAIALNPSVAVYHSNLGLILKEIGNFQRARVAFEAALQLRWEHSEDHYNLGVALQELRDYDRAIASYRQAISQQPDLAKAWNNLGNVLRATGRSDEGIAAYKQAVDCLQHVLATVQTNLGNAYKDQGRLDEAIECYRWAVDLLPENSKMHSNLVYSLHFHPNFDLQEMAKETRHWRQRHADPLKPLATRHSNNVDPDRKLRIGYVAPHFYNHCQSLFLVPLLSHHEHDQFQIYLYGDVSRPDALTTQLQGYADYWRSTTCKSDEATAELIVKDEIDILVDLSLHMENDRLLVFARKPAPVQVTWLGYPSTTGLDTIDYRLTDPYLDPPGTIDDFYSEQSYRLPDTFWCYDPLAVHPTVNPLPALTAGHITFGCLNNFSKVNQWVLERWSHVLRALPRSRMFISCPGGSCRQRTLAVFQDAGVAVDRIEFYSFLPRHQYLELYHQIDLALDTFPYNGHTTSLDAMWMGVPTITLIGSTPVGRAGWCQLSNVGLPELAATSANEFVRIAVELANDLPRLAKIRSTLRSRMRASPLMDGPRFTRHLEAAYRSMWQRWCEGQHRGPRVSINLPNSSLSQSSN